MTPLRIVAFAAAAFGLVFATSPASAERLLKIVAFGDSLTAGYGLPTNEAFPAKLQRALASKGVKVDIVTLEAHRLGQTHSFQRVGDLPLLS